jgi:hypothetical protein
MGERASAVKPRRSISLCIFNGLMPTGWAKTGPNARGRGVSANISKFDLANLRA